MVWVGEVILSHVFEDLRVETSKSPDVMVFIPHSSGEPLARLSLCDYSDEAQIYITEWSDEVLQLARSRIHFKRG